MWAYKKQKLCFTGVPRLCLGVVRSYQRGSMRTMKAFVQPSSVYSFFLQHSLCPESLIPSKQLKLYLITPSVTFTVATTPHCTFQCGCLHFSRAVLRAMRMVRWWTHRLPPEDGSVLRNPLVVLVWEDDWQVEGILLCVCTHIVLMDWRRHT